MYRKTTSSWLKHWDFLLLDLICLQLSYWFLFRLRQGFGPLAEEQLYRRMALVFVLLEVFITFFFSSYKNVLKRGRYAEFLSTFKQSALLLLLSVLWLFLTQEKSYSRLVLVSVCAVNWALTWLVHLWYKRHFFSRPDAKAGKRSLLILTCEEELKEVVDTVMHTTFGQFALAGVVLMDGDRTGESVYGVPIVADSESVVEFVCRNWVDEVFIHLPTNFSVDTALYEKFADMGVTVHEKLFDLKVHGREQIVERLGTYTVLTTSMKIASTPQLFIKRVIDIIGGLIGCLITGILFLFLAPCIYIQSPGPIFFSQVRVGKGGKKFKIYKFRSMYLDAEKRKAELMAKNNIQDGRMFKMDNDPRIIGSEKGPNKGIGNFIRKTSLDEFPQFFNVLKGDMSLIGTRPPTVDEWEKYELHHRARLAIRPGLTGMWQVSGRSDIVDFEEVVKLDRHYIERWSFGLDVQILLKTVWVVLRGEGSK